MIGNRKIERDAMHSPSLKGSQFNREDRHYCEKRLARKIWEPRKGTPIQPEDESEYYQERNAWWKAMGG